MDKITHKVLQVLMQNDSLIVVVEITDYAFTWQAGIVFTPQEILLDKTADETVNELLPKKIDLEVARSRKMRAMAEILMPKNKSSKKGKKK